MTKPIPILIDHNEQRMVGKLEGEIITFLPEAKVTVEMLCSIGFGGRILEYAREGEAKYVLRARVWELSIQMPGIHVGVSK